VPQDYRRTPEALSRLTRLQYRVTQEEETEPAFRNRYWDNHDAGIYVDVVSGQPLFSSIEKFESGSGWPCFTGPLHPDAAQTRVDRTLPTERTEVRSVVLRVDCRRTSPADGRCGSSQCSGAPSEGEHENVLVRWMLLESLGDVADECTRCQIP